MAEHNPYSAPESEISVDIGGGEHYQPKIFTAEGRIGRMRYWVYNMLATLVIYAAIGISFAIFSIAGGMYPNDGFEGVGIVGVAVIVVLFVLAFSVTFIYAKRRLNDVNQSGWLSLLMLVPVANLVMYLYLLFAKGTAGSNQYGLQPVPNSTSLKIGFALSLLVPIGFMLVAAVTGDWQLSSASMSGFEFSAE